MRAQLKANNNTISLRTYLLKSQHNTIPTMTQKLQRFRLLKDCTAASQAFKRQGKVDGRFLALWALSLGRAFGRHTSTYL